MATPRKVVFINRYFWPDESATAQMLTDLAFELAQHNFEVTVITSRQRYNNARAKLPSFEKANNVTIHRLAATAFGRLNLLGRLIDYLSFYLAAFFAAFRYSRQAEWLITKTDPPMLSVLAVIPAKFRGVKTIAWSQDIFPEIAFAKSKRTGISLLSKLLKLIRNWSLEHTDHIVVIGDDMKHYLTTQIKNQTITVIPNWAHQSNFQPIQNTQNPLRKEWELTEKCVIGYSGNLGRVHEYNTILQSAKILAAQDQDTPHFLFIGSGRQYLWLQEDVPKELSNVFSFKPYQPRDRLHESLSVPDIHWVSLVPECSAFVVPSKLYGILAVGRPVIFIGNADSALGRFVENKKFGFSVNVDDVETLTEKVNYLIQNPEERESMGARAKQFFEEHRKFECSYQKWQQLLTSKASQ